jgi:hypothetical protein
MARRIRLPWRYAFPAAPAGSRTLTQQIGGVAKLLICCIIGMVSVVLDAVFVDRGTSILR